MSELTKVDMEKFIENVLKGAKENLETSGSTPPLAYIWGMKSDINSSLQKAMVNVDSGKPIGEEDLNNGIEMAVLIIPCLYDDPKTLFSMIIYLAPNDEERAHLAALLGVMESAGLENPYEVLVKGFRQAFKVHQKDIVASFLKKLCHEVKAIAIAKIDESWIREDIKKVPGETLEQARERFPGGIESDPERKEGVQIVVETKTFRIGRLVKFERESQDVNDPGYKRITWGTRETMMDETVENQTSVGRFLNILMPEKSAAPSGMLN